MALTTRNIIGIVIALLLIGILLPLGIGTAPEAGVTNGTGLLAIATGNATIDTLVPIIAVMAVIGMVMAFIPRGNN